MFIHSVVDRLSRLLPSVETDRAPCGWCEFDSNWYTSSFELAQGLEVIEHQDASPPFADTMPAFQSPPPRRMQCA
jgi:hypothetical protein